MVFGAPSVGIPMASSSEASPLSVMPGKKAVTTPTLASRNGTVTTSGSPFPRARRCCSSPKARSVLPCEPEEVVGFAARAQLLHACDQADLCVWKIALQSLNGGNNRVVRLANGKNDLVFRVIQNTHAGKILVSTTVNATNGLQHADRRRKG